MRPRFWTVVLPLIAALGASTSAQATLIEGTFQGRVDYGNDAAGQVFSVGPNLAGKEIVGRFSYDSDRAPADYCGSSTDGCYDYLTPTDAWLQLVFTIGGNNLAISNLDGSTEGFAPTYTEQLRMTPAPGYEGGGDRWTIVDFDWVGGASPQLLSYGFLYLTGAQFFDTDALDNEFNWSRNLINASGYGEFSHLDVINGRSTSARFTLESVTARRVSVPEPSTWALLLVGCMAVGMSQRIGKAGLPAGSA